MWFDNIFVLNYSLGGALAVRVASKHLVPSLIGMVVIDVVEGKNYGHY